MCIQKDKTIKGVKIGSLNVFMMIAAIILSLLIFVFSAKVKSKYNQVVDARNDYSECSKAINDFKFASDFMTNQARLFVVNQEPAFVQNYFYEKEKLQHRNIALEIVEMTHNDDAIDVNLKLACNESTLLEKSELYAMRLACSDDLLNKDIPQQLLEIKLLPEHTSLSSAEKIIEARQMLFSAQYLAGKERISTYSNQALSELINIDLQNNISTDQNIFKYFRLQTFLVTLLIVLSVVLFVIMIFILLRPLDLHIDAILKNKKMEVKGSYELRYIAKAYNTLCERNEVKASLLKHKAEHDPLTGLINREAFNQIKEAYSNSDETIAYLIIDIDLFKDVNDQYGHPIGDEILKKISGLLMEQFRATDYVARIGGDEFAIIMTKFGTSAIEIIQRKIDSMNYILQSVDDGLPSVSLSVGVAFSESGFKPELIEQADKALYRVKRGGRCNCSFYKSEE